MQENTGEHRELHFDQNEQSTSKYQSASYFSFECLKVFKAAAAVRKVSSNNILYYTTHVTSLAVFEVVKAIMVLEAFI